MTYAATLAHLDARELVLAEAVAGARFLCEVYAFEARDAEACLHAAIDVEGSRLDKLRAAVRYEEAGEALVGAGDLLIEACSVLQRVRDERAAFVRAHLPGEAA
jgi:hypothetical protein